MGDQKGTDKDTTIKKIRKGIINMNIEEEHSPEKCFNGMDENSDKYLTVN